MKPTDKQVSMLLHLMGTFKADKMHVVKQVNTERGNLTGHTFSLWVRENLTRHQVSSLIETLDEDFFTKDTFEGLLTEYGYNNDPCNSCAKDHEPEDCMTGFNQKSL